MNIFFSCIENFKVSLRVFSPWHDFRDRCMTYLPRSRRRFRSPALRRSVGLMILPLLLWFSVSFSPYRLVYVNLDFATATVTLDVSVSPALSLIVTISPVPALCIMIGQFLNFSNLCIYDPISLKIKLFLGYISNEKQFIFSNEENII